MKTIVIKMDGAAHHEQPSDRFWGYHRELWQRKKPEKIWFVPLSGIEKDRGLRIFATGRHTDFADATVDGVLNIFQGLSLNGRSFNCSLVGDLKISQSQKEEIKRLHPGVRFV